MLLISVGCWADLPVTHRRLLSRLLSDSRNCNYDSILWFSTRSQNVPRKGLNESNIFYFCVAPRHCLQHTHHARCSFSAYCSSRLSTEINENEFSLLFMFCLFYTFDIRSCAHVFQYTKTETQNERKENIRTNSFRITFVRAATRVSSMASPSELLSEESLYYVIFVFIIEHAFEQLCPWMCHFTIFRESTVHSRRRGLPLNGVHIALDENWLGKLRETTK